ncbi:MAG: hypothetical protein N2446_01890 [Elusimicrobiales bacterium]|nr:hypothetical protein [Elusimicrobiales bacterium]
MKKNKIAVLLKVKKNQENIEVQKLNRIKSEIEILLSLKEIKKNIRETIANELKNQTDAQIISNSLVFIEQIRDEINKINNETLKLKEEFENQKNIVFEKMKDRKKIEEFKNILEKKEEEKINKAFNMFIEEVAVMSYSRRKNGNRFKYST